MFAITSNKASRQKTYQSASFDTVRGLRESLKIYYDERRAGSSHLDSLEINGVNGTVGQWRQVFLPLLKTRR